MQGSREDGGGRMGEQHRQSTGKNIPHLSYWFGIRVGKGQEKASRSGRKALTKHCHFDAGLQCLF